MTDMLMNKTAAITVGAGEVLTSFTQRGFSVGKKPGKELVTEADIASETLLREQLTSLLPGSGFLGEESWNGEFPQPPVWIADPLDGTNNYACGIPFYCVSVALMDEEGILLGCVHDPLRMETFTAERGKGAFLNGKRIFVSEETELSRVILATGFPYTRTETDLTFDLNVLKGFLGRAMGLRRCGSAALDLAYTAAGRFGGFWEEKLNPWDMAAGALLVQEAGGRLSGFREESWTVHSPGIQCSAPGVWKEFRRVIKKDALP